MGIPQDNPPYEEEDVKDSDTGAEKEESRPELELGPEEGPEKEPALEPATDQERTMGMLCHLLALTGFVIPFGNVLGPLIIWLVKREEMPFVDDQGKESLNFQITVTIAVLVSTALTCLFVGFILLPIVVVAALVFVIIAGVKANQGELYRYPVNIRFIK